MRIGMIGTGGFAAEHAESIKRVGAELAASWSYDSPAAREMFASKHGGRAVQSQEELVDKKLVDAVYIVAPPTACGPAERLCIEKGIPFLREKPLALDIPSMKAIAADVKKRGMVTASGFLLRYGKTAADTKSFLAGRRISAIRSSRMDEDRAWLGASNWRLQQKQSGGWVMELGVHTLDFMRYVLGEAVEVQAMNTGGILAKTAPGSDIEDSVALTLRFESGAIGSLILGAITPPKAAHLDFLDVYGENFRFHYENIWDNCRVRHVEGDGEWKEWRVEPLSERHDLKTKAFLTAVAEKNPDKVLDPYCDALKSCILALAVNTAAATGKTIKLGEWMGDM